jgi:hypothetical protein
VRQPNKFRPRFAHSFVYEFATGFADRFAHKIGRSGGIPHRRRGSGRAISPTSPLPVEVET